MKLFDHVVAVKATTCSFNGAPGAAVEAPYVNLYTRVTNVCQANCSFCEFHGSDTNKFKIEKFEKMLTELSAQVRINKVSFTGGEPTLASGSLTGALKVVKKLHHRIFTVVNTNGCRLTKLNNVIQYIDSIALSRHHYDDSKNAKLFGLEESPTTNADIEFFKNKNKLHLSCNLVKGYIDSTDECYEYIDFYSKLGVHDYGFVSLMGVNDYAKEHLVDFEGVELGKMPNTINSKQWRFGDSCKCNNYMTLDTNGDVSHSYARYAMKSAECVGMLVYDQNVLKVGFNGPVLRDYNS